MKTKYDWSNVPDNVKWIATDEDGVANGFINEPCVDERFELWVSDRDEDEYPTVENFDLFDYTNWRNSLEGRPL